MQKMPKTRNVPSLVWVVLRIGALIGMGILQVACGTVLESLPGFQRQIEKSTLPLPYKWSYSASTTIDYHPIAVAGLVLVRTDDSLIALNAETGEPRWMVPGQFVGFPVIAVQGNIILFASNTPRSVQAIDLRNGTVLWTQEPYGPREHVTVIATDKQRAYVGLNRAFSPLQAYDLSSGELLWVTDPLELSSGSAYALEVNENELAAVVDSNLFILDSGSGALKKTISGFYQGNYLQLVNQVALTWFNGSLLVKDVQTGNRVWQFDKTPSFFNVIGDRVYVSSDCCALHALEFSTGQLIWERPLLLLTGSEVVTVGDTGYVMLVDGSVLAFDTATGADRGKLETTPHSVGINFPDRGLGTDGSALYATFGENKVFAFGP